MSEGQWWEKEWGFESNRLAAKLCREVIAGSRRYNPKDLTKINFDDTSHFKTDYPSEWKEKLAQAAIWGRINKL